MHSPENNYEEKIMGWIDRNRTLPGQKILCIGTGIEPARHLARLFPSSQVVCLTGSSKKERTAATDQRLADGTSADSGNNPLSGRENPLSGNENLLSEGNGQDSLREPLLIEKDASSYDGGRFDTIVACGGAPLLPENPGEDFPRWARGDFYLRKASLLMEYYEEQAHLLHKHLKPGGALLNLVQSERDEYLLGYCLALAAEEMSVDPSSIRRILCRRDGKRLVLHGITAFARGRTDIQSLIAGSLNDSLDRMNTSASEYEGRDAEIMLQADAGELLRGYHIYQDRQLMGKLAVYSSVQDENVIYYFTDVVGDTPYLKRFHAQDRDLVIRHMVGELHRQKAADKSVHWAQLELRDDWSETEL